MQTWLDWYTRGATAFWDESRSAAVYVSLPAAADDFEAMGFLTEMAMARALRMDQSRAPETDDELTLLNALAFHSFL